MTDILTEIVATKKAEVEEAIKMNPLRDLMKQADVAPPTKDFVAALAGGGPIRLIAEVKKASPSQGVIREDFEPVDIAQCYADSGASCISVLTDTKYFQGSIEYLSAIREATDLPLLRKDFVVHPYQIFEARVAGADAVLLIAECLNRQELRGLHSLANDLGMATLIELYSKANLDNVLNTGTPLVGINNRDLKTFEVDLNHTIRMRELIPDDRIVVGESGIDSRSDALLLEQNNIQAMLVGSSLMRKADIGTGVKELLGLATA